MSTIKTYKVKFKNGKTFTANIERYDSAQEVVRDCRTRKITDSSFHDQFTEYFSKSWEGVDSYDEALDLLRNGYQPTVDAFKASMKIGGTGSEKRIAFENNVHGFAPIVPLALKGVPNSMINMTMRPMKCKVVDVYYDIGVNSGTSPETIIENGQKVLGAIIALEKQGYRFNLYAFQSYNDPKSSDMLCVKVKSSDKPIDLKRISFPLTHPAFFRVIGFDWVSKMPIAKYRSRYGHPFPIDVPEKADRDEFVKQAFGDNAIYISNTELKNKGIDYLKEVLAK